ncbi:MAG: HindVP family restriction endonuclease [bacterium]|nr:HindVP family restriction endonuclease [bacterium]
MLDHNDKPGLYGIVNSNKDFTNEASWGKNQFNNTFPAALASYMAAKNLTLPYIKLDKDFSIYHDSISVKQLFGIDPASPEIFFSFESEYEPYRDLVEQWLPRVDLVIKRGSSGQLAALKPLEVKLTALPDDQTSSFGEEDYGSELVVRPDTIVYLALSMAHAARNKKDIFAKALRSVCDQKIDWTKEAKVEPLIPRLIKGIDKILLENPDLESPLMIQPIWKTKGKSVALTENCLDIFVWSNFALTRLFINQTSDNGSITRPERTIVWLAKMLHQFSIKGKIDHQFIIDSYTYGTKNDKAFAIGGLRTREYMRSPEIMKPRITRSEIKNIILGGGERLLSPERRFDGIVQNAVDLFS